MFQCEAFGVARRTETRRDLSQVGVVVAGMRDEFPCARRQLTEQGSKCCCVEASGGEHADGAVGGGETFFCGDAAEGGLKPAEEGYLRAAKQGGVAGCVRGSVQAPGRLKRIADGSDSGCPRGSQYGAQDGGEHVDVLVGVNVG